MATSWMARCLLSGLHVLAAIAACGSLVAVLLQWAQNLNCLPPVTDNFGDPVSVKNSLGRACDMITYSSGVVCGLSLLMAVSLNCCWGEWCCTFLHQLLALLMASVSIGSGAALTMDFLLWCNSLQNTVSVFDGCENAARMYDRQNKTSNMTAYFRKMELQQACQWAVVPFLLCAVVVYSVVMKTENQPQGIARRIGGRYYILCEDELSPLIPSETALTTSATSTANRRQGSMTSAAEPPRAAEPESVRFSANPGSGATNVVVPGNSN